jgi:hypothetical protein
LDSFDYFFAGGGVCGGLGDGIGVGGSLTISGSGLV